MDRIRRALLPSAPLFANGLLLGDSSVGSSLNSTFCIAPAAAAYLLQLEDAPGPVVRHWDEVPVNTDVAGQLARIPLVSPPVILETDDAATARLAAQAVCFARRVPLLKFNFPTI